MILAIFIFLVFFKTIFYDMVIDDNCRRFHSHQVSKNWLKVIYKNTKYSGHGGLPLKIDHLFTIILHTIVCIMIYKFLGDNIHSFVTALLFAVLPSNTQVSIWLNGKRFATMAILTLLMWKFLPFGIGFYLISPLWGYNVITAIFLALFTDYKYILLLLPILFMMFHVRIINKFGTRWESIPQGEIKTIRPRKLVILIKMLGYIFLHSIFPRRMSFYHMFMERFGFSDEDNKYWYSFNKIVM